MKVSSAMRQKIEQMKVEAYKLYTDKDNPKTTREIAKILTIGGFKRGHVWVSNSVREIEKKLSTGEGIVQ